MQDVGQVGPIRQIGTTEFDMEWLHLAAMFWVIFCLRRNVTLGTKKSGKGRRKVGRKKRRMRAKIRHRKK